ncbi:hypothetical protein T492DRAFT_870963 [Pavlovales sp. CCMP2436]|nr:hypothetical protein T492DRAFT_870963 [Pavlovales sp. CCMP2436]
MENAPSLWPETDVMLGLEDPSAMPRPSAPRAFDEPLPPSTEPPYVAPPAEPQPGAAQAAQAAQTAPPTVQQRTLLVACGACSARCRTLAPPGVLAAPVKVGYKCPSCGVANEFVLHPAGQQPAEPVPRPRSTAPPRAPRAPSVARPPTQQIKDEEDKKKMVSERASTEPKARRFSMYHDVDYTRPRLSAQPDAPEYVPVDTSGRSLRKRKRIMYDDKTLEQTNEETQLEQLRVEEMAWDAAERRRLDGLIAGKYLLPKHELGWFEKSCRALPRALKKNPAQLTTLRNRVLALWHANGDRFLTFDAVADQLDLVDSKDLAAKAAERANAACVFECLSHHGVLNAGIVVGHPSWLPGHAAVAEAARTAARTAALAAAVARAPPPPAAAPADATMAGVLAVGPPESVPAAAAAAPAGEVVLSVAVLPKLAGVKPAEDVRVRRAIVVGAGLAGLAAARQLRAHGWERK